MVSSWTLKHDLCPLDPLPLLNNSNVKKNLGLKLYTVCYIDYITCTFIILYIQKSMEVVIQFKEATENA